MIDNEMKGRLRDAFYCSFLECTHSIEYRAVVNAMVEIFTAINLTADDIREISSRADGSCAEVDECIDELIKAFEE